MVRVNLFVEFVKLGVVIIIIQGVVSILSIVMIVRVSVRRFEM